MKTELSKREKILIFIAAAAIMIFVSFEYVISPMYNRYTVRFEEYEALSLKKDLLKAELENEEIILENHKNAKAALEEIERRYPAVMPSEEADRIVTGLCVNSNLRPVRLDISIPEDFFAESEDVTNPQDNPSSEPEDIRPAAFVTVNATMSLSGDYPSFKRLLDATEKLDYIRVANAVYLFEDDDTKLDANISVIFELTMINN